MHAGRQRAVGDRSRAANGVLSTYQWRAAACALIIHVITIERTHPGRAPWRIHGVFAVRPGWKPPPPRLDPELSPLINNEKPYSGTLHPPPGGDESGLESWRRFARGRSLRKRVARSLPIFACNFEYSRLSPPLSRTVPVLTRGYCSSAYRLIKRSLGDSRRN